MITRKNLLCSVAEPLGFTLMSDLHIGGASTDHASIQSDLKLGKDQGDRISINGDIFDAILPKDHKRYRPEAVHPELRNRSDMLNGALDMAFEMLEPYAKQIDMLGCGNHEDTVAKYNGLDIVQLLVYRLNKECGSSISYGGYTGFISYSASSGKKKGAGKQMAVVIYYHHGAGGSSPVTKGMIDFNRKGVWVDSDVVWLGHKHNKLTDTTPLRMRCPQQGDQPILDQQVYVMSGSYLDTMKFQTQQEIMNGRVSTYAADWGLPPQAKGGARVLVKMHRDSGKEWIKVLI